MKTTKSKAMRKREFLIGSYVALLTAILAISLTALLNQKVFATTYVINDGDRVVTYTSRATDPAEVLGQAGIAWIKGSVAFTRGFPTRLSRRAVPRAIVV